MTITSKQCDDFAFLLAEKIDSYYTPLIGNLEDEIQQIIARGEDPTKVSKLGGAAIVNYVVLIAQVKDAREAARGIASQKVKECMDGAVPNWIGDAEKAANAALVIIAMPFVVLTGNYAAVHVDLAEVYKGKPLGGDGALIPKARDDVLDSLGLGGDLRKAIVDPKSVPSAIIGELEKVLPRIKWKL
jgi:hypothetical protein